MTEAQATELIAVLKEIAASLEAIVDAIRGNPDAREVPPPEPE